MPRYAKIDGITVVQFPYTVADFRQEYPNTSVPRNPTDSQLAEFDVVRVEEIAQPPYDLNFNLVEGVEYTGSNFRQTWTQVPASQEEIDERIEEERLASELQALRDDPVVQQLVAATPQQIDNYITNNVTNLADAQRELAQIYKILAPILRNTLT